MIYLTSIDGWIMLWLMEKLSHGQLKVVSEFFNTIAAAWFTGGIVAPFFTKSSLSEKLLFFAAGFTFSYVFLSFAILLVKGVKA